MNECKCHYPAFCRKVVRGWKDAWNKIPTEIEFFVCFPKFNRIGISLVFSLPLICWVVGTGLPSRPRSNPPGGNTVSVALYRTRNPSPLSWHMAGQVVPVWLAFSDKWPGRWPGLAGSLPYFSAGLVSSWTMTVKYWLKWLKSGSQQLRSNTHFLGAPNEAKAFFTSSP